MQRVTIPAARADLSRLIDAALSGEDVVIARDDTPFVRLVPVPRRPFRIGILAARLGPGPDFLAPADEAEHPVRG